MLSRARLPCAMDDLNPADFTVLQSYLDSVRVKRGLREKVLDDAAGLFPGALVLFKDNGNVCSTRHVTAVPSVHETYPLHRLVRNFIQATYHINPWGRQNHPGLGGVQGDAGVCPLRPCAQYHRTNFLRSLHQHPHHPVTRSETRTPTPAGP